TKKAEQVINEINKRGKLPIIVGGTGLYLNALFNGLDNYSSSNWELRAELEKLSVVDLQKRVEFLSPARWEGLNYSDQNNPRRLIRIIEQLSMYPHIDKLEIRNLKFEI